jgi:hypothetical protein
MFQSNSSPGFTAGVFTAVVVSLLLSACTRPPDKRSLVTEESSTLAGGRPRIIQRSDADERALSYLWRQQGQFVRIETAEPGAEPHQHPLTLTGEQVKDALQRLRVGTSDGTALLSDEAIAKIAAPLSQALGQATADQEVCFAVAFTHPGLGRLMSRRVTTGRLFRNGEGLNLIIGLLHTPFENKMLATGHRIAFTPGSRQNRVQEGWSLRTDNLVTHPVANRDDWVLIDARAWSDSALARDDVNTPQQTEPKPEPVPSTVEQKDRYQRLEERLAILKKLRDKRLISEEAYQLKSQQILDEL